MRLFLHGDLVYLPEDLSVVDLGAAGRFHNQAFSPAHFRDECRVTVRFAAESGLEVSDELAAAAAARIEKLYAGHAPRVPDAVRSAFAADLARTRRALRERISWEATARRVFAADALEIAAPAERLDEARALAAAVEPPGCAARVHPSEGPAIVVAPEGDPAAAVEPSELPWPVDGERFAP